MAGVWVGVWKALDRLIGRISWISIGEGSGEVGETDFGRGRRFEEHWARGTGDQALDGLARNRWDEARLWT